MTDTTAPTTALILDCATSGLSPEKHTILEICVMLVNLGTLDIVNTHNSVIRHDPEVLALAPRMHAALVKECKDDERNKIRAVEGFLLAGDWTTADCIINRSLWFDLKFVAKHMPTLHRALPKKQFDLKELAWFFGAAGQPEYVHPVPRTFRASDDAIAAYAELLYILSGGVA